jgi:hypothetical protein
LKVNQRFGRTPQLATYFQAGILLSLFNPEDEGEMFL